MRTVLLYNSTCSPHPRCPHFVPPLIVPRPPPTCSPHSRCCCPHCCSTPRTCLLAISRAVSRLCSAIDGMIRPVEARRDPSIGGILPVDGIRRLTGSGPSMEDGIRSVDGRRDSIRRWKTGFAALLSDTTLRIEFPPLYTTPVSSYSPSKWICDPGRTFAFLVQMWLFSHNVRLVVLATLVAVAAAFLHSRTPLDCSSAAPRLFYTRGPHSLLLGFSTLEDPTRLLLGFSRGPHSTAPRLFYTRGPHSTAPRLV